MPTLAYEHLDTFTSQEIFRLLLTTLSQPGYVGQLPVVGLGAAVVPLALADVETTVAVRGDDLLRQHVVRATGSAPAAWGDAELVACCDQADATAISGLCRGSALSPELGAKAGISCRTLHPGRPGDVTLSLSGPGVSGSLTLGVDGLARDAIDALSDANRHYPAGIDVWLIDQAGRIAGLPRTCQMEVF
jgi:alpha-D-ribose 1-methylphosphonate 5-triphosphate synthase subunit PhnH